MRKRSVLLALTVLALASCAFAQGCRTICISAPARCEIRGSGIVAEKAYNVSDFKRVDVSTGGSLVIESGDAATFRVEGEDNIIERLEVEVVKGELRIRFEKGASYRLTKPLKMYATTGALEGIEISGSCDVRADRMDGRDLEIEIAGSGDVVVDGVSGDRLEVEISGSGDIDLLDGSADVQSVEIAGSGDYDGLGVVTRSSEVSIAGSGNARVNVTESLAASIAGSGSIRYSGDPGSLSTSVAGSGSIRSM